MRVLELFAGSQSFSNTAETWFGDNEDFKKLTTDIVAYKGIDIVSDIFDFPYTDLEYYDIIWASPPCTYFSVSSIGHHWNRDHSPKTKEAKQGMKIVEKTIEIIDYLGPQFFFIENPRGKLRKLDIMKDIPRKTVTYCH